MLLNKQHKPTQQSGGSPTRDRLPKLTRRPATVGGRRGEGAQRATYFAVPLKLSLQPLKFAVPPSYGRLFQFKDGNVRLRCKNQAQRRKK